MPVMAVKGSANSLTKSVNAKLISFHVKGEIMVSLKKNIPVNEPNTPRLKKKSHIPNITSITLKAITATLPMKLIKHI